MIAMNILVNFAGSNVSIISELYRANQEIVNKTASRGGIDRVISWDLSRLKRTQFYRDNQAFLDRIAGEATGCESRTSSPVRWPRTRATRSSTTTSARRR